MELIREEPITPPASPTAGLQEGGNSSERAPRFRSLQKIYEVFFVYLTLALVYGSILLYMRQKLQVSWYWYLLLGFVDVQGNYLISKAFQFTSLTSATLLDCWTIAWVIILTRIFIGTRYSLWQLFGVAVCLLGLALVVLSDAAVDSGGGSRPLLGDVLVMAATLFIAMSSVDEEILVKNKDRVEMVCMIGVYGSLFSLCEIYPIHSQDEWSHIIQPLYAQSDMWAVVFRIIFYHQQVNWLCYQAFAIVVIGLVTYNLTENEHADEPALDDGNQNMLYHMLDVENINHLETECLTS
ncbi:hypothetical protein FEM48_Zijuj12G0059100 [Ziziphus jujuba var. spinosa]|uniref:Solute carrier family 35 member F2-like n=1 Tax=Ziziphus jujuba var. spinosa TaxID=714518 RepID=A0A978UBJ9_ZIZJJ|nr:hypothetical protein FEM48_Zijuj12G0059100 [Ziziphus jujuba var. spinosa]